jgi:predicted 2-oxoglutarate/Fe(II)-dependent dioxygenase YbiX
MEIQSRLIAIKHDLGRHFRVSLSRFKRLQFLVYREGYHFRPHIDGSQDPSNPLWSQNRRVSISIFLNREGRQGDYEGGPLTFYGLIPNLPETNLGIPVVGEEGLLIGFPSDMLHAVQPVERGVRYSVVTWFA